VPCVLFCLLLILVSHWVKNMFSLSYANIYICIIFLHMMTFCVISQQIYTISISMDMMSSHPRHKYIYIYLFFMCLLFFVLLLFYHIFCFCVCCV
jgi:hypothetical protein